MSIPHSSVDARTPGRAWLVWGCGLLAYVVAVFHRSSLAVTGIEAQERFGAGASAVSLFVVVQLAVYAALQVPVGVAVDRFGSRRMIVLGALTMAAGQLGLALASSVPAAVGARLLVGAGDAMTFISVLRLVPMWFPARRVPMLTQLTGLLGQAGQIAAAFPLVALLAATSWTVTFAGAAAVGLVVALLVATGLRDAPAGVAVGSAPGLAKVRADLRDTWREPGTRLGMYTHLTTQFSGMAFGLLWGFPFLTVGQGLSPATAAGLLTLLVLFGMVFGPVLGQLCGRWPLRRSVLVFSILGATASVWTLVLLWPGRAPLPLLVLLVLVLATNGPGSMIGFDFARTDEPGAPDRQRQRRRQRRRVHRLAAGRARHRHRAGPAHAGLVGRLLADVLPARLRPAVPAVGGRPGGRAAAPPGAARPARRRRGGHRAAVRRGPGPAAARVGLPLSRVSRLRAGTARPSRTPPSG